MKLKDKKELVLKELYKMRFDGKLYDIQSILTEIGETNPTEARAIAKSLDDEGLIRLSMTKQGSYAEINSHGIEYIENLHEDKSDYFPEDRFSHEEKNQILEKLEELSQRLNKIEVGQQITYDDLIDEIEVLKQLLNVLGKKDWRQILKGKLVDAGLGSLSENVMDILIDTFKDNKLLN